MSERSLEEFWPGVLQIAVGLFILLLLWSAPIGWLSDADARQVAGLPLAALMPTAIALQAVERGTGALGHVVSLAGVGLMALYPPIAGVVHAWGAS